MPVCCSRVARAHSVVAVSRTKSCVPTTNRISFTVFTFFGFYVFTVVLRYFTLLSFYDVFTFYVVRGLGFAYPENGFTFYVVGYVVKRSKCAALLVLIGVGVSKSYKSSALETTCIPHNMIMLVFERSGGA